MNASFAEHVEHLGPAFDRLMACPPSVPPATPRGKRIAGVYVFSERGEHLYVGRTNDLRGRYNGQRAPGATYRMAAFAFRLARVETGRLNPRYRVGPDSRKGLMLEAEFSRAFERAKARIRTMDFRFAEEGHPTRQALLEIYTAVMLQTPHNNFDNH